MSAIFPMISGINFEEFGSSVGVLAVQIEFVGFEKMLKFLPKVSCLVFFWWVEGGI